jgi:sugar transferase (PEP-CTERM/EpsH1 system associated)
MDILFLTSNLPYPPTDGWKIRVYSLLRHLSIDHRVSLISFMRTTEDPRAVEALRTFCADLWVVPRDPSYSPWKLFLGLVGSTAFSVLNYRDKQMMGLLKQVLEKRTFDIVQAESLAMAQYCVALPHATILDLHNIESLLIKRYAKQEHNLLKRGYAEVTWRKLATYERETCKRFTRCLTCSTEDRRLVQEHIGVDCVNVIPNGVDLQAYVPDGVPGSPSNRVVFVGRMDYHANVDGVLWFCRKILPYIRRQKPDVLFQIVGGFPSEDVRRLAIPGQIEVTGFVEDVRPYLKKATAVVVPLRIGGGTRLKILEAFAMGKAVISTSLGAEGISVVGGREILLADSPEQFASKVLEVLDRLELRESLQKAGRHLVEACYSWTSIGKKLEGVYQTCSRIDRGASYPHERS